MIEINFAPQNSNNTSLFANISNAIFGFFFFFLAPILQLQILKVGIGLKPPLLLYVQVKSAINCNQLNAWLAWLCNKNLSIQTCHKIK